LEKQHASKSDFPGVIPLLFLRLRVESLDFRDGYTWPFPHRYTRAMKTNRLASLLFALLVLAVLAACGNKGPLVHPDKAAPAPAQG